MSNIFDLARETNVLERLRRMQAGERLPDVDWIYFDPIAPGPGGEGLVDEDLSPPFESGFSNVADECPFSFALDANADVVVRGSWDGPTGPTALLGTLPEGYRPEHSVRLDYPKDDTGTMGVMRIDPNGEIYVLS